ncbi:hypothetical protein OKW21_000924 [Catalinimonas alkaloidigena]|nr:hypothetical protein [Catalinimonas alkaloidigena]
MSYRYILCELMRIKQQIWGTVVLSIDFGKSVEEEANVSHPSEL